MAERTSLAGSGWSRVAHNKRYIVWFYILNLVLAALGAAAFSNQAHEYLDHSLQAQGLVRGLDIGVLTEMLMQPDSGPVAPARHTGVHFAFVFFLLSAAFLPGVLQGYASTYRLPREEFFRACGRNLWRFIRLLIVASIVIGAVAYGLFEVQELIVEAAGESTNEVLPFEMRILCLLVAFLVLTLLRIGFDLAQTDVVLSDQNAVLKSSAIAFRHTWHSLGRLLASYVLTTVVAVVILGSGLLAWEKLVPAASVVGAFVVTQLTLLLLLIPRFWQRGVAVSYYLQNMVAPIAVQTGTPVVGTSIPAPVPPLPPAEPQAS